MTASLVRTGRVFDDAGVGFNHVAAEQVYGSIMKCETDEEAAVLASMYLGDMLAYDLVVHRTEIGKAAAAAYRGKLMILGKNLARQAVEKERNGEDSGATLVAIGQLETLAKAFDFTSDQRADTARKQKRDLLTGRFIQEHKSITHLPSEKALSDQDAKLIGIQPPVTAGKLTARQKIQYQRGYREVQDMLDRFSQVPAGQSVLHLNYATGKPSVHTVTTPGEVPNGAIDPKRRLESTSLSVLPSADLEGAGVQARFGPALDDQGLLNADTWSPEEAGSLADHLTRSDDNEQYATGARRLRRVGALSTSINQSVGPAAPPKLKLALSVGEHAGTLGPEAQKVIGPTADRAAYRYRGTERKGVDSRLQNALASVRRNPNIPAGSKREAMIHGAYDDQANWQSGPVLSYFRGILPRADLNTLQRKSGNIPPSQGVIVDSKGRVASQSVGFGDDHYLPFNLKRLGKLRGGEYIRTRTFGGPTTEDIYTGLIGGAKSETVVSHNGVYTIEFDDDLKGGRRFNDKAAKMVSRYGQLLDAVQSEQVRTGGIDPSRMEELRTRAAAVYDPDREPDAYESELGSLTQQELRRPRFSEKQRAQASADYFNELAANRRTSDGHVMSAQEMVHDEAQLRASTEMARLTRDHGDFAGTPSQYLAAELDKAGANNPDPNAAASQLATYLGQSRGLNAHLRRSEGDYVKSLRPLSLNGQGYQLALESLQEQFPYYIKRVDFHPWDETSGLDPFDTGYVKPKHNRPAKALAGYFDATINGHGKVRADSTRFQNFPVRGGRLDMVPTDRLKRVAGAPAGGNAKDLSGPVDPDAARVLKEDASRRLIDEFRRHDKFGPHAKGAQGTVIANQDVAGYLRDMQAPESGASNLARILATPKEGPNGLEAMLRDEPERMGALLQGALRENESRNYLDLDGSVVRHYRNEGLPDPTREIGNNAIDRIHDAPGTEYAIPGSVFSRDHPHSTVEIANAYAADPRIQDLVSGDYLPQSPADGAEFTKQASALRQRLAKQQSELATWKVAAARGNVAPAPYDVTVLNRQAEGLLHAEQIQRRYTEARGRETLVSAGSQVAPSQVIIVNHGDQDLPPSLNQILGT